MRLIDKIKKMGSLLILSTCCLTSCNFLDVVPPDKQVWEMPLKSRKVHLASSTHAMQESKVHPTQLLIPEWKLHLLMNLYSRNYGDTADSVPVGDC